MFTTLVVKYTNSTSRLARHCYKVILVALSEFRGGDNEALAVAKER